jgi:hypothetical protein
MPPSDGPSAKQQGARHPPCVSDSSAAKTESTESGRASGKGSRAQLLHGGGGQRALRGCVVVATMLPLCRAQTAPPYMSRGLQRAATGIPCPPPPSSESGADTRTGPDSCTHKAHSCALQTQQCVRGRYYDVLWFGAGTRRLSILSHIRQRECYSLCLYNCPSLYCRAITDFHAFWMVVSQ